MEIYDLLREDHAAMLALVRQLTQQPGDSAALAALTAQFEFHDLFEREVLYSAIENAPGGVSAAEQALAEHGGLDALLATLDDSVAEGAASLERREQIADLARALAAHVTREEGPLFELAHGSISAADAAEMAEKYRAAKRKLLDG